MARRRRKNFSRTNQPYGNWAMLHPDGFIMCRTTDDRMEWYTSKGLATVVSTDPPQFKLTFKPKGPGNQNDPFYHQQRKNECVVCGKTEHLTQHHCVPAAYRKLFPPEWKSRESHDVFPLCLEHHRQYEHFASDLKRELGELVHCPPYVKPKLLYDRHRARALANVLYRDKKGKIPFARRQELEQYICKTFEVETLAPEDIRQIARGPRWEHAEAPLQLHCRKVYQHFKDDLHSFNRLWRQHFIDTMQPQYMPAHWSVDFQPRRSRPVL